MDTGENKRIYEAWCSGTPLGNDKFKEQVERQLSKKIGQAKRGRPYAKCKKGL